MNPRPITVYGQRRNNYEPATRSFTVGGIRVTLQAEGSHFDSADESFSLACDVIYDSATGASDALNEAQAEATRAADVAEQRAARVAQLEALIPKEPKALLGVGCVRWVGGEMWVLNKRETGWSSSGFRIDGWDELFRRWRAVVIDVGADEHGAYVLIGPKERA